MKKILLLGRESRLRDEIESYLITSNYDSIAILPKDLDFYQAQSEIYSHWIIIHEFPVFRNLETLERIMKLNPCKMIIITSDYSLRFKKEITKCKNADVIYRPFLPEQLNNLLNQDKH